MKKTLNTLISDIDGVLLDTEGLQWQGWNVALEPFGIMISKEQYFQFAGKQGEEIESILIERHNLNVKPRELLEKKEAWLEETIKSTELHTMDFARETLEFFLSLKWKIGAASSSTLSEIRLKLGRAGLLNFFSIVVSKEQVKKSKPFPDIYLLAAKELDAKPHECLVLEDSFTGVKAAKAAGMICIAIPNKYTEKQDFSIADTKVSNLREAVRLVKSKWL